MKNIPKNVPVIKEPVAIEKLLEKLSTNVPGMVYQFMRRPDGTYCVPFSSQSIKNIFGCSPEEVRNDFAPIGKAIFPSDLKGVIASIEKSAKNLTIWKHEFRVQLSGQPIKWLYGISTPEKMTDGSVIWHGFVSDFTERKVLDIKFRRINRALKVLSESNQALIRIVDEQKLLSRVCQIIVKFGGYRMAWIGFVHLDGVNSIHVVARAGADDGYLSSIKRSLSDIGCDDCPTSIAARTRKISIVKNILDIPILSEWNRNAIKRGYKSVVALPLIFDETVGVITIYSDEVDIFDDDETKILEELVADLSFGIHTIRSHNKRILAEEEFKIVFDNSSDGILLAEVKSRKFILANNSICRMLGYSSKEILNLSVSDIHPKEKLSFILKDFDNQSRKKYNLSSNIPLLRKDGTTFYADINTSIIKLNSSIYLLGMFRDVTTRYHSEQILIESEARFRTIFEHSPVAIFMVSLLGKFIQVNEATTKLLGYSESELQKKTFAEITHPDEAERDFAKIKLMVSGKIDSYDVDKRYITKSKEIVHVHIVATLIRDKKQNPLYFLTIAEDITKRKIYEDAIKKSEEKYSTLVENSSDGVIVIQEGIIKFANPAVHDIAGYNPKDLVGKPMVDFISPRFRILVGNNYKRRMLGEKIENRYEFAVIGSRGQEVPIEASNSIINFEGKIADMSIIRDISRAKQIDKIKTEFISVASHQLRGPLTGIKWFSQLIIEQKIGKLNEKQQDYIKQVYDSNERMIRLINDLLDVSHIETGQKFVIEKHLGSITALIDQVIKDQKISALTENITVELDKTCPKDFIFSFDQDKIYQVFANLIDNAIKYSPGNKKVIIGVKCLEHEVRFFVKDFGLGIPPYQKNRIFQKFFRADNIATTSTEGTGLGLYIAKSIVESHGGRIWFESELNKGTTFYFMLPLGDKK